MIIASLITLALGAALTQLPPLSLHVSMISIGVKDPSRSLKFYGETLGLDLVGKPGEVTLFRAGDVTIVLNQPAGLAAGQTVSDAMEIIFPVDSVTSYHAKLLERGCHFIAAPHEVKTGMWAATFTDPDGHNLTILGAK